MPFRVVAFVLCAFAFACTQEQQNKLRRDVQNWTGTNGVLEIYAGEKVVRRFLKVDKPEPRIGLLTFIRPEKRNSISP